jgi:alanine racemase
MTPRPSAREGRALAGPELTVDLDAIAWNTRLFARRTSALLMAVVKADGFGHGSSAVASTALANGASWLGVTTLDEAFALRRAGITAPVLSWLNPVGADFRAAVTARVDVAVPSVHHLREVAAGAAKAMTPARVHLHIDVGMARDGAEPVAWPGLCDLARSMERRALVRVVGVMGHLGWADDPGDPSNAVARWRFAAAVAVAEHHGLRPSLRHLAATSASLTDDRAHFDLCRVGAGLVGIDPSRTTWLRPAMTLTAPVIDVREVAAGTSVGYGHTFVTSRRTRLALVAIGYADGVPRTASGRASVQVGGHRSPVVGLVSMDQVVVDIGPHPVGPGDVATVFGPGRFREPTVADWAEWAGTIEHEIVTGIGARVVRRFVPESSAPQPVLVGAGASRTRAR